LLKKAGEPHSRYGRRREKKDLFLQPGIKSKFLDSPARCLVTMLTEIYDENKLVEKLSNGRINKYRILIY
jgi:hypothetical protein